MFAFRAVALAFFSFVCAFLLLFSSESSAQTDPRLQGPLRIVVTPPNPAPGTTFEIAIRGSDPAIPFNVLACVLFATLTPGNVITLAADNPAVPPPPGLITDCRVQVGPLAEGQYTVTAGPLIPASNFLVGSPNLTAVPANEMSSLVLLSMLVALIALLRLRLR